MLAATLVLALAGPIPDSAHYVHLEPEHVVIDSEWSASTQEPLATPLPDDATMEVLGEHTLRVTMPRDEAERDDVLPLPLPPGDGVHRVTFDHRISFRPDPSLELAPRGTRAVGRNVHRADIRRVDMAFGRPRKDTTAHYVHSEGLRGTGGFAGSLKDAKTRRQRLMLFASALFIFVVAGLMAIARAVRRRAEAEHADEILAREIDSLATR
ncbi:MAG: hypothetical protein AAF799_27505 [Myxococcota bacterium]